MIKTCKNMKKKERKITVKRMVSLMNNSPESVGATANAAGTNSAFPKYITCLPKYVSSR
jgi:hypothetical protein